MTEALSPLQLLPLPALRGRWSLIFVGCILGVVYWIYLPEKVSFEEESISVEVLFAEWKRKRESLNEKKDGLDIKHFTTQIYSLYAQGIDMLEKIGVQESSLKEICVLTDENKLLQKEKELFGSLYTPLFSATGRTDKKRNEIMGAVYELISERYQKELSHHNRTTVG